MNIKKQKLIVTITLSSLIGSPLLSYAEITTLNSDYASAHNIGSSSMLGSDQDTWSPTKLNSSQSNNASSFPINGTKILRKGESISSNKGIFKLILQDDGNLVIYNDKNGKALWSTETDGKSVDGLYLQLDGNVVLYDNTNSPIFATHTLGKGKELVLQDDGNLVVYDKDRLPLWATGVHSTYGWDKEQLGGYEITNSTNADIRAQIAVSGDNYRAALWDSGTDSDKESNKGSRLMLQDDGNVVLYTKDGKAVWDTNTHPKGLRRERQERTKGKQFCFQDDGNLVVYNKDGEELWESGTGEDNPDSKDKCWGLNQNKQLLSTGQIITSENGQYSLTLQDDGNLVEYVTTPYDLKDYRNGYSVPKGYGTDVANNGESSYLPPVTQDILPNKDGKVLFGFIRKDARNGTGKDDDEGKKLFILGPPKNDSDFKSPVLSEEQQNKNIEKYHSHQSCWSVLQSTMKPTERVKVNVYKKHKWNMFKNAHVTFTNDAISCDYKLDLNHADIIFYNNGWAKAAVALGAIVVVAATYGAASAYFGGAGGALANLRVAVAGGAFGNFIVA